MSTEIDTEVADFVLQRGFTYNAIHTGTGTKDGWTFDQWKVTFDDVAFEFKTGLGLRKSGKPVKPSAATVLHSLLLDSSLCDQPFDAWCSELGYDTDSRKALRIYEECKVNADKLNILFSPSSIAALATIVEGY